ncbi:hypothetical protein GY45DRAFT_1319105 [Cubamyces sp. BRFM 1775]|nr:hypothetical protein GY45DRAFT_1319105 [Cubamyces sp. BRFM 1775]
MHGFLSRSQFTSYAALGRFAYCSSSARAACSAGDPGGRLVRRGRVGRVTRSGNTHGAEGEEMTERSVARSCPYRTQTAHEHQSF